MHRTPSASSGGGNGRGGERRAEPAERLLEAAVGRRRGCEAARFPRNAAHAASQKHEGSQQQCGGRESNRRQAKQERAHASAGAAQGGKGVARRLPQLPEKLGLIALAE